jgi:hypothetical protein
MRKTRALRHFVRIVLKIEHKSHDHSVNSRAMKHTTAAEMRKMRVLRKLRRKLLARRRAVTVIVRFFKAVQVRLISPFSYFALFSFSFFSIRRRICLTHAIACLYIHTYSHASTQHLRQNCAVAGQVRASVCFNHKAHKEPCVPHSTLVGSITHVIFRQYLFGFFCLLANTHSFFNHLARFCQLYQTLTHSSIQSYSLASLCSAGMRASRDGVDTNTHSLSIQSCLLLFY